LDELLAAFPAITQKRQALNQALIACVTTIEQLNLADRIAVDGSFITSKAAPKAAPSDIDLIMLTPGVYQQVGEQHYTAVGIDTILLDIQFGHDLASFQGWIQFFSIARNSTAKGVVELVY